MLITALLCLSLLSVTVLGGILWTCRCTKCNDCCCDGDCDSKNK